MGTIPKLAGHYREYLAHTNSTYIEVTKKCHDKRVASYLSDTPFHFPYPIEHKHQVERSIHLLTVHFSIKLSFAQLDTAVALGPIRNLTSQRNFRTLIFLQASCNKWLKVACINMYTSSPQLNLCR